MAAAEPTKNQFAGTGLGINYIGTGKNQHAYAYSGVIDLTGSAVNYLDFTTAGASYIVGKIKISADWSGLSSTELYIQFFMNGDHILFERDTGNNYVPGNLEWPIFLPPNARFQVQLNAGATQEADVIFVGRVYEVK